MSLYYAQHIFVRLTHCWSLRWIIVSSSLSLVGTEIDKLIGGLAEHIIHFVTRSRSVWIIISVKEMSWHVTGCERPAWFMQRCFSIRSYMGTSSLEYLSNMGLLKCWSHGIWLTSSFPKITLVHFIHHLSVFASFTAFAGSTLPDPSIIVHVVTQILV